MVKIFPLLVLLLCSAIARAADASATASVFVAHSPAVVKGGNVQSDAVRRMVDSVVMAATGKSDVASAWGSLVRPTDRVGIKVSASGAPVSSTHAAVVSAVAEGLVAAGVSPQRIVIWDRKWDDMRRTGYGALSRRFLVTSTDRAGGYSKDAVVTAASMGKLIDGDRDFNPARAGEDQTSSKSHISVVLANGVDKVVHVPALSDHLSSGLNGALSGMVLDNLDNWRRLARPPHFGDPFLAELYSEPLIGGKVVLTVLDALRPQFAGGPFPVPQYVENYGAIYASRDPVAIDVVGLDLIDGFRKGEGMPLLAPKLDWLQSASMIGLGVSDRARIRVVPLHASAPQP